MNAAIYPWFLVWVCFNRHCRNNILYALPNEPGDRVSIFVDVIPRRGPEHIPVRSDQNSAPFCRLVSPALNRLKHRCFLFSFLPIGGEEQNGGMGLFTEGVDEGGLFIHLRMPNNNDPMYYSYE
jgi:hypothetical protein